VQRDLKNNHGRSPLGIQRGIALRFRVKDENTWNAVLGLLRQNKYSSDKRAHDRLYIDASYTTYDQIQTPPPDPKKKKKKPK